MNAESNAYSRGYAAGLRRLSMSPTAAQPQDDDAPRYQCFKCGTTWHGSRLVARWQGAGRDCGGTMEKLPLQDHAEASA
jgi:hypothetical protein